MVKHKCFGCKERHIGCHSSCESWLIYEKEKFVKYDERKKLDELRDMVYFQKYLSYKEKCNINGKIPMKPDIFFCHLAKIEYTSNYNYKK